MQNDEARTISNPQLISAIYFSVLAMIATLMVESVLYALGLADILPLFKAILLGAITAAVFGALFGKKIIHSQAPYRKRVFWLGFLMVVLAIPVYDIGLLVLLNLQQHSRDIGTLAIAYLAIIFYSFLSLIFWLPIMAGVAAIYLRGTFVYYIVHSLNVRPPSHHGT